VKARTASIDTETPGEIVERNEGASSPRNKRPKQMIPSESMASNVQSQGTASSCSLDTVVTNIEQIKHFYRDTNFSSLDFETLQKSDLFVSEFILQGLRGTLTYSKKERNPEELLSGPAKKSKIQEHELRRQLRNQSKNESPPDPSQPQSAVGSTKVMVGEEYLLSVPCKIVWNHGQDEETSLENEVLLYSLADMMKEQTNTPSTTASKPTSITTIAKAVESAAIPEQHGLVGTSLGKKLNLPAMEGLTIDTSGSMSPPFKSPVSSPTNVGRKCSSPRGATFVNNSLPASMSVSISTVTQIVNQASRKLSDVIIRPFKVASSTVAPARLDQADEENKLDQ
jgi:hypothetical protein